MDSYQAFQAEELHLRHCFNKADFEMFYSKDLEVLRLYVMESIEGGL